MLNRLLPHPGLTGFLILFWLVLANSWTFGSLVMATLLGLAIPIFTAPWWPDRPRLRHPLGLVSYTLIVLWDVIVSSFQVAGIILFRHPDSIRSAFIPVPLRLTSPEAARW